jgi:hypothetical protein
MEGASSWHWVASIKGSASVNWYAIPAEQLAMIVQKRELPYL